MIRLTVYSRPQCHLCDTLLEELAPLIAGVAEVEVEVVDIGRDPGLEAAYGQLIPVLKAGELELSRYRLDRGRVLGYLADFA